MSTKVTWLYGNPERDGPENDYHLYFDYKDMTVHLEINGKEVPLPPKLRRELEYIFDLQDYLVTLFSMVVALAEHTGTLDAYRSLIRGIGDTSFGRSPVAPRVDARPSPNSDQEERAKAGEEADVEEEEVEDFDQETLDELEENVERVRAGVDYTLTLDEVHRDIERGYRTFVEYPELSFNVVFARDDGRDLFIFHSHDGSVIYYTSSIPDAVEFILEHGGNIGHLRKFLDAYADYHFHVYHKRRGEE